MGLRNAAKSALWKALGPGVSALVARYAHDTRYAHDPGFAVTWRTSGLVLASLRQDYHANTLEFVAELLANHTSRTDLFDFWQQHGFSVYPQSYMSPFPSRDEIPETRWEVAYSTNGIDMNQQGQLDMLRRVFPQYGAEFLRLSATIPELPAWDPRNPYYSAPDAEVLYCFIRRFRPKRVIEVGSGYSTLVMSLASQRNRSEGSPTTVTAVDPEPRVSIQLLDPGVCIVEQPVQMVDTEEFRSLEANDILFIDSSHVIKIGGDVIHEILEILPVLQPGVIVHFHDIFLPDEYPRSWVMEEKRFWTEQYLLHAFLIFNRQYEILWASHYMHRTVSAQVQACFSTSGGSSFWIRRRTSLATRASA